MSPSAALKRAREVKQRLLGKMIVSSHPDFAFLLAVLQRHPRGPAKVGGRPGASMRGGVGNLQKAREHFERHTGENCLTLKLTAVCYYPAACRCRTRRCTPSLCGRAGQGRWCFTSLMPVARSKTSQSSSA